MAALNKLSAVSVRVKGAGKYEDGGGLRLVKASKDAGKWVFRFTAFGRRREMGLGALSNVSLRVLVKRILRKYGYPPDLEDAAVQGVLAQAEALLSEIVGNTSPICRSAQIVAIHDYELPNQRSD